VIVVSLLTVKLSVFATPCHFLSFRDILGSIYHH